MRRTYWCFLLLAILAGAPALAAPSLLPMRADGIGPWTIGMTFDAAQRTTTAPFARTPMALRKNAHCEYVPLHDRPGLALVFVDDLLVRIDVTAPGVVALGAIDIGASPAALQAQLGPLASEPLDNEPDGDAVVVPLAGRDLGHRYEFIAGRLAHVIVGQLRAIRIAEGCD